jgi:hypothetical protein
MYLWAEAMYCWGMFLIVKSLVFCRYYRAGVKLVMQVKRYQTVLVFHLDVCLLLAWRFVMVIV